MNLRTYAKGKPCMVRLPNCDGGGETTVLAHYRLAGYCGTGMKPDDLAFGSHCCFPCHQKIDGREPYEGDRMAVRLAHAEGVMKTVAAIRQDKRDGKL